MAESDNDWELRTGHRQAECKNPHCNGCICCTLSVCTICGGLEGSLLPRCPGRQLAPEEHEANYADYCHGLGPFAAEA